MGINQAQNLIQQLMQQLGSNQFAQGAMNQLGSAGLGKLKPKKFFDTPFDEQVLRQAVLGNVLGFYGGNQGFGGIGDPMSIFAGMGTDKFTGGIKNNPFEGGIIPGLMPREGQAGQFGDPKFGGNGFYGIPGMMERKLPTGMNPNQPQMDFSNPGGLPPELYASLMQGVLSSTQQGGPAQMLSGNNWQNANVPNLDQAMNWGMSGGNMQQFVQPGMNNFNTGNPQGTFQGNSQFAPDMNPLTGQAYAPFKSGGQSMEGLYQQLGINGMPNSDFVAGMPQLGQPNHPAFGGTFGGAQNPQGGNQFNPNFDAILQAQLGNINMDFDQQKQAMLNDLFGRGMNASTAATDAGGKLLFGRNQLQQQAMSDVEQQKLDWQKFLMAMGKGGGGSSINMGGPGGVGSETAIGPGFSALNAMLTEIDPMRSDRPLNFEQQLAQQKLELERELGRGQLGLGGRELDIQQLLGLGGQNLQRQGLSQDLMQFLLGQGLQRQNMAGNMGMSEQQRLMQYLMNQQNLMGNMGQFNAQLEAQKRSPWGNILGGIMGGLGAFSGLGGFSGIGSLFGLGGGNSGFPK